MKCIKIVGLVLAVWLAAMAEIQAAQQHDDRYYRTAIEKMP